MAGEILEEKSAWEGGKRGVDVPWPRAREPRILGQAWLALSWRRKITDKIDRLVPELSDISLLSH